MAFKRIKSELSHAVAISVEFHIILLLAGNGMASEVVDTIKAVRLTENSVLLKFFYIMIIVPK